jgi:quercetin dioxygenase-like cupin family protein
MNRPDDNATQAAGTQDDATPAMRAFREAQDGYRWEAVPILAYKPAGTHFQGITRQVLFGAEEDLACQLRYFEIEPGGYSTLERHEHVHAVLILRGQGRVFVSDAVHAVAPFDLVYVPPRTWHQFRADDLYPLGFLCLVPCDRDRPARPDAETMKTLRALPGIGDFVKC